MGTRTFCLIDDVESDERDGHCHEWPQGVKHWVGDVESGGVPPANDKDQSVNWNDIYDEDVASPCGNHVVVRQSAEARPHDRSCVHSFDPEVKGEYQCKYGYSFIIIWSTDRSRTENLITINQIQEYVYREMYDGTIAVNAAANNPADDLLVTSVVNK